jgi:hypothetical protein
MTDDEILARAGAIEARREVERVISQMEQAARHDGGFLSRPFEIAVPYWLGSARRDDIRVSVTARDVLAMLQARLTT